MEGSEERDRCCGQSGGDVEARHLCSLKLGLFPNIEADPVQTTAKGGRYGGMGEDALPEL